MIKTFSDLLFRDGADRNLEIGIVLAHSIRMTFKKMPYSGPDDMQVGLRALLVLFG